MKILSKTLLALLLLFSFVSCNNEEGEGGTGTIKGCLMMVQHPEDAMLETDTVPAAKSDVFIVYGDDEFYGDDVEADPNGYYQFEYLTPGDYTVFSYSTLPSGEREAVSATVTLDRGAVTEVPTMYVHEGKAYGTSIIKGRVWATYYHNGTYRGEGWACEHRVYIRKEGETCHFDDVRVGADGYFCFQKVEPGVYEVFTVTEDMAEIPSYIFQTVTVNEAGEIVEMTEQFNVIVNV